MPFIFILLIQAIAVNALASCYEDPKDLPESCEKIGFTGGIKDGKRSADNYSDLERYVLWDDKNPKVELGDYRSSDREGRFQKAATKDMNGENFEDVRQ